MALLTNIYRTEYPQLRIIFADLLFWNIFLQCLNTLSWHWWHWKIQALRRYNGYKIIVITRHEGMSRICHRAQHTNMPMPIPPQVHPSTPPLYGGVDGWTWGGGRRIVKKLKKQKNVPVEDTSGRRWTFWHLALRIFAPSNSKTRTLWFATSLFYCAFSVHSPSLAFWCLCSFLFPKATRYQLEPSRRALEGLGFIHK